MKFINLILPVILFLASCSSNEAVSEPLKPVQPSQTLLATAAQNQTPTPTEESTVIQTEFADVLSVSVTGEPGAYQFSIEVSSPDTGCEQYADWWEVVSQDGELLYRRILLHSHAGEQPFTRPGGPVAIEADTQVNIRAHMNTSGYGGQVMGGTVHSGFEPVEVEANFGSDLERIPPQPGDCAF